MNETVKIIVGAGYGDEGKGATVAHFIAQDPNANWAVVRFNGGAQAGHTVVDQRTNTRFVFHHFGSGSLQGAATVFGSKFLIEPLQFIREREELYRITGRVLQTYALPSALIQHPVDMLLNQLQELQRGNKRHGSCGTGIFETIKRNEKLEYSLSYSEAALMSSVEIDRWVRFIFDSYLEERLVELKATKFAKQKLRSNVTESLIRGAVNVMVRAVNGIQPHTEIPNVKFIFEGAQGLNLSMNNMKDFPHLTPSDTGVSNAVADAGALGIPLNTLQPVYVTRTYATRHGAGPLAHEGDLITSEDGIGLSYIQDETNVRNDWQGVFRCAPLDLNVLFSAIATDYQASEAICRAPVLALRCIDQMAAKVHYYTNGKKFTVRTESLRNVLTKFAAEEFQTVFEDVIEFSHE